MGSSRETWRQTRERIYEAEIACDEKSMDLSEKEIILKAKQERLAAITKDIEVTKSAKVECMERSNDYRTRILDVQKAIKEERQKRSDLLKVQKEASTRLQELRQSTASCRYITIALCSLARTICTKQIV
ncbi:hypothetical protein CVIRNUC_010752 [Coccomyxa viridis]|uniref:Uncharacterized protein n=1 Tax=Coccomyxa viridis TaxID=1274662 RepID=A0AAV1IJT6_9CHLO|nr:hypothetical protein CVIRNUC_010752 [Coccomyxa viridis]